ncbi:hypothetical protein V8C43DRAFT_240048 [Trichoderma afarasin]
MNSCSSSRKHMPALVLPSLLARAVLPSSAFVGTTRCAFPSHPEGRRCCVIPVRAVMLWFLEPQPCNTLPNEAIILPSVRNVYEYLAVRLSTNQEKCGSTQKARSWRGFAIHSQTMNFRSCRPKSPRYRMGQVEVRAGLPCGWPIPARRHYTKNAPLQLFLTIRCANPVPGSSRTLFFFFGLGVLGTCCRWKSLLATSMAKIHL